MLEAGIQANEASATGSCPPECRVSSILCLELHCGKVSYNSVINACAQKGRVSRAAGASASGNWFRI